jgi:hypothetical protein
LSIDFANGNKSVQAALEGAADKRGVKAKPTMAKIEAKVVAKKAATKAATPSKAAIEAQLADLEDAPF